MKLTEREIYVLRALQERVKRITKGETPTRNLAKSIVSMCSVWNFPVMFKEDDPKEIAIVCKSLADKGFVRQFEDEGFPSFVPTNDTRIVEYSYREFKQSEVH